MALEEVHYAFVAATCWLRTRCCEESSPQQLSHHRFPLHMPAHSAHSRMLCPPYNLLCQKVCDPLVRIRLPRQRFPRPL